MYNYDARLYDPALAMFISPDSIMQDAYDPQLLNPYSYCRNNPLIYTDPTGHMMGPGDSENFWKDYGDTWGMGLYYNLNNYDYRGLNSFKEFYNFAANEGGGLYQYAKNIKTQQFYEDAESEAFWVGVGTFAQSTKSIISNRSAIWGAIKNLFSSETSGSGLGKIINVWCFPPGTLVLMADGDTKAIENVEIGDYVLTNDPENGDDIERKIVVNTTKNKTKRFIHVIFETNDNLKEGEFSATGEHPIWTKNRGWIFAKDLDRGDILQDVNGNSITVLSTWEEKIISDTYNLSVDGVHTFFIVANETSILVHNDPPRIHPIAPDWAQKGAHVTSNGIELSITGGGSNIRIQPVFSSDLNNPGLKEAIKNVESSLSNSQWRNRLLNRASEATKYLGKGDELARSTSGSTRALAVTLERWCK